MNILLNLPILIAVDFFLMFVLIGGILLNRYGKWPITKSIVIFLLPFYFLNFPLFFGDIGTEYYNFVFLILGFYILDSKKTLVFVTIYITLCFLLTKYFILTIDYDTKYATLKQFHYYPSVLASVAIIASAISVFKSDTNKYQKSIIENSRILDKTVKELSEKDLFNRSLIRELNHRVKNNIQLISGLITLQTYQSKNKEVIQILKEARNRLDTIMILHQHLYQNEVSIEPNIKKYIEALVSYLIEAFDINEEVEAKIEIEEISLPVNLSVHIGLIFNELIVNSLKYRADKNGDRLLIDIGLKSTENGFRIFVRDNGQGFPDEFCLDDNNSFGLGLVQTISQQYNGEMHIRNVPGAEVEVKLYTI